jgi:hypothetical protein
MPEISYPIDIQAGKRTYYTLFFLAFYLAVNNRLYYQLI